MLPRAVARLMLYSSTNLLIDMSVGADNGSTLTYIPYQTLPSIGVKYFSQDKKLLDVIQ